MKITGPSPWDKLRISMQVPGWTIGINKLFNEVLNSQSCLAQLVDPKTRLNLIGLVLHAPNHAWAGACLREKSFKKIR